jgi:type IV secretion system protein VirD4
MSFMDGYRQRRASRGVAAGATSTAASSNIIGGGKPSGFYAGCYRDPVSGARGPEIWLPWLDPVLIVGRNRVGKDTGIIIPNALMVEGNITQVFQDTRHEVSAITLPYRRTKGPALVANAFGELVDTHPDLRSNRVNLLKARALDPDHPLCFENLCALVEAMIPESEKGNPFFPLSAQALWAGLIKAELKTAKREGRDPSLLQVRVAATEAEELDEYGEPVKGLRARARRLVDDGDEQINSMLGGFAGEHSNGIRDVIATSAAHTRWCLSGAIIADEKTPEIDFGRLGEAPSTLYYGVPHDLVKPFAPYLRLFTTALLRPLFAPHPVPVRVFLNEFAAMGRVPAIESAIGLVAGCSIQLVMVVQSLVQLKHHYGDGWEAFFGQAGAVILVGSPGDDFTADYLAKHSGDLTMRQPSAGLNLNPGGVGLSSGEAYGRRQYLMPQDLRNIRRGEGYIWLAGLNDPIPAVFPPYYADPLRPELAQRARANPYFLG